MTTVRVLRSLLQAIASTPRFLATIGLLAATCLCLPLTATTHAQAPSAPTRVVLLVDSSTAVQAHFQRMRPALTTFVEALPEGIEVGLISTGGQLRVRVAPTTDRAAVTKATNAFTADGGGNAFMDALLESYDRFFKKDVEKRAIFVIVSTDSENRADPRLDAYQKFLNEFRQRRGVAHAAVVRDKQIGFVSQISENLTANTGGVYQVLQLPNALPGTMAEIASRIATAAAR
jgi:hypothetical protein